MSNKFRLEILKFQFAQNKIAMAQQHISSSYYEIEKKFSQILSTSNVLLL